jgi:Fe-S-cluster containining protein
LGVSAVEQLCPNCGLCCDGTLFADVELRAGDDAKRLAKLGLTLKKKGRTKTAFAQPCACFNGTLCTIYAERPKRCRLFECGLLKKVNAGEMKAGAALKKIAKTKELVKKVEDLLKSFGADEDLALSERYAEAMGEPVDLTSGKADRHGQLMQAYEELMRVLQRDFLR